MINKGIKKLKRIIAGLLSALMLFTFLTACSEKVINDSDDSLSSKNIKPAVTTEQIADAISDSINTNIHPLTVSYNWKDYVGDIDAFVYGLIINEYELCYNVFDGVIDLPDGTSVYGIGYTDYADYYETDDEKGYFPCGFISLIGEPEIPQEYIDNGLEVKDLEYDNPDSSFVLAYETNSFTDHCVIWEQYLQYGVDENGQITYNCQPYERGRCDETLGSLYSYDEQKWVVDFEVGDYVELTGLSLSQSLDYAALEDEINRIIDEQDRNFANVEIETYISFAHDAVNSYLLSMQEEAFMGIPVKELIEISKELDPMECIRITPDGTVLVDIDNDIPETPDALTKWLVGISCGIVVAGAIALDIFVPALVPVSGAISGVAVEVFMQVVFENQTLENVQWSKVAVSAVSGAVIAWACPALAANVTQKVVNKAGQECVEILGKKITTESLSKLAGYSTLTFTNALASGATGAAFAAIDGKSLEEVFDTFLIGTALGGAFTAGATVLANSGGKLIAKLNEKITKKFPNSWLKKISEEVDSFINDHKVRLKNQKLEKILVPKSINEAAKSALGELEFFKTKINNFIGDNNPNFVCVDSNSKVLTKDDLLKNGGNCFIKLADNCDEEIKKLFEKYKVTKIPVKDGLVDFSQFSVYIFKSNKPITADRTKNYDYFFQQLADDWNKDPSKIPDILKLNLPEGNLNKTNVKKALSAARLTPHEAMDNMVYLVDKFTHEKISHAGGVSYAKLQGKVYAASKYINMLSNSKAKSVFGVLIAEEVSD